MHKYTLYVVLENATALGSLIRPRAVTRCNLAVSDMYMRDFGKTHQIASFFFFLIFKFFFFFNFFSPYN